MAIEVLPGCEQDLAEAGIVPNEAFCKAKNCPNLQAHQKHTFGAVEAQAVRTVNIDTMMIRRAHLLGAAGHSVRILRTPQSPKNLCGFNSHNFCVAWSKPAG
jgi:hypothetical protein